MLPGYDYDVGTEEVLLTRMSVRGGRLLLSDGMSYRVLVLPDRPGISLPVLRKVKELVEAGATVIGPKPTQTYSLTDYPHSDAEVARLANELWGEAPGASPLQRRVGKGRIIYGRTAREVLEADGLKPDFDYSLRPQPSTRDAQPSALLDYIHRASDDADLYFVANRSGRHEEADCAFRVSGKAPELWDPVSGGIRPAAAYSDKDGRITLPLQFAPYGSMFIVFRSPLASTTTATTGRNFTTFSRPHEITGPWAVQFDPKWGGPASAEFDQLVSWTQRPEAGIKYFSGTATYRKTFDLPETLSGPSQCLVMDRGT